MEAIPVNTSAATASSSLSGLTTEANTMVIAIVVILVIVAVVVMATRKKPKPDPAPTVDTTPRAPMLSEHELFLTRAQPSPGETPPARAPSPPTAAATAMAPPATVRTDTGGAYATDLQSGSADGAGTEVQEGAVVTGAMLVVIEGPHEGETFSVTEGGVLGREPTADVPLFKDTRISRQHAQVYLQNGAYRLRDTGSSNGTLVNGVKVAEVALKNGDRIQVGRCELEFRGPG